MTRGLVYAVLILSAPIFSFSLSKPQCWSQRDGAVGSTSGAPSAACAKPNEWTTNITPFIDASFTYWFAGEEGLPLAVNGVLNNDGEFFPINTGTLFQSSDYKPGFKVGVGVAGCQEWMLHAEYTWFRARNHTTSGAPLSATLLAAGTNTSGSAVWDPGGWFLQAPYGPALSSTWRLAMDLIDAIAGRPFCQGRCLTLSPFGGLRAALIRQSITITLTESTALGFESFNFSPPQLISSRNHSNSWAIGPRAGCEGQWLLPRGFRLEGALALSLLYTRYTSVKHSEAPVSTTYNAGPYTAFYRDYNCLRPELDLGVGFGWESSFRDCYQVDFSASYDFMIFWAQNMMRKLLDDTFSDSSIPASDLYLHGLTLSGCFNF